MGVFAPAFGLVGTLIGLVFMLFGMGNQGSGSDAASTLGGAMGIALITTFYGAVLANLIFIPFSEKIKFDIRQAFLLTILSFHDWPRLPSFNVSRSISSPSSYNSRDSWLLSVSKALLSN